MLRSELVEPHSEVRRCRDPDDNKFLETAVEGRAGRLVSGDADLLALGSIEGVAIVSPASFLDELD